MADMSIAPRDGTRILIRTHIFAFEGYATGYVKAGTQIVECWWKDGKWREWLGKPNSSSTQAIDPIEWWPHPDLGKDPEVCQTPSPIALARAVGHSLQSR